MRCYQVDKLVRVRRLLSRLEFLSELPEKLSEMIEKEVRVNYCCSVSITVAA